MFVERLLTKRICFLGPTSGEIDMSERGMERERSERVARMYSSNDLASKALGITARSFSRLCRKYGIETPYARRRGLTTASAPG
ncbi:MAG: hypothetical protein QF768_04925 [Candidatus Latescibacteria bacterium]|nr:hypothetical protein [Candidatus Latescibacterota bacterium]